MPKFYGTFMLKQAFTHKYVEIHAFNVDIALNAMFDHFGDFSCVYTQEDFLDQPVKYRLDLLCVIKVEITPDGEKEYSDGWNAEKEIQHWKSNHADMVKRCEFLSQRDDLPVDRIPAIETFLKIKRKNELIEKILNADLSIESTECFMGLLSADTRKN